MKNKMSLIGLFFISSLVIAAGYIPDEYEMNEVLERSGHNRRVAEIRELHDWLAESMEAREKRQKKLETQLNANPSDDNAKKQLDDHIAGTDRVARGFQSMISHAKL